MQSNNSVAEFLIELIKYADDEDIAVLLSNCNNRLTQNISVTNYKTALFNYLFEYIYAFIEPKLPTLQPLLFKDNKIIRVLNNLANIVKNIEPYISKSFQKK